MPTSPQLRKLYSGDERDVDVYELNDLPGLQVVRKYEADTPELKDKRMFMKFIIREQEGNLFVIGGVEMVKNKGEKEQGWTIVFPEEKLLQNYTGYYFNISEDVRFDPEREKVLFKGGEYSVTQFISLLEKNHQRDMFWRSRFLGYFKRGFLHLLFFLSDSHYVKYDHIGRNMPETSQHSKEKDVQNPTDPLFHYFHIYKNLFGLSILLLLVWPIFCLSNALSTNYFTVTNPLWLFSALLLMYALEKISSLLLYTRKETDFVQRITISSMENKGELRKYKIS